MNRPEHAADCPGCDTGWTTGELLCPRCEDAVHKADPSMYPLYLEARNFHSIREQTSGQNEDGQRLTKQAFEKHAYTRGVIVGAARILSIQRTERFASYKRRRQR